MVGCLIQYEANLFLNEDNVFGFKFYSISFECYILSTSNQYNHIFKLLKYMHH
jgi:hypothetical protein